MLFEPNGHMLWSIVNAPVVLFKVIFVSFALEL